MKACLIPLPSSAPSPRRPPLCRARSPSLPLLAFGLFSFLEGGLGSVLVFRWVFLFSFFRFSCRVPFSCLSFVYFTFLFSSFVSFILASRISFVSFFILLAFRFIYYSLFSSFVRFSFIRLLFRSFPFPFFIGFRLSYISLSKHFFLPTLFL